MRIALILGLVIAATMAAQAQADDTQLCKAFAPQPQVLTSFAFMGYTLTSRLVPDNSEFPNCKTTIRTPSGHVVFEAEDAGISVLKISGSDLTASGVPDLVLETYSGGVHCCSTYIVIALGRSPKVLWKFMAERFAGFSIDRAGHGIITTADNGFDYFDGLYHGATMADLYIGLDGDRARDLSGDHLAEFDKEIGRLRSQLAAPDESRAKGEKLQIVLDYLYSNRPVLAWAALDSYFPAVDRARIRSEIETSYCHGLRVTFGLPMAISCR